MSNLESMIKRFLVESQRNPQKYFYRYFLSESQPTKLYVAEAVVGLTPTGGGDQLFTLQAKDNKSSRVPPASDQYYEELLHATLPTRALQNEDLYSPQPDREGLVIETEYQVAYGLASLLGYPLVAAIMNRPEDGSRYLAEFFSILPLRPSIGLPLLQDRIRKRLTG